jgi:hypothetical protein
MGEGRQSIWTGEGKGTRGGQFPGNLFCLVPKLLPCLLAVAFVNPAFGTLFRGDVPHVSRPKMMERNGGFSVWTCISGQPH